MAARWCVECSWVKVWAVRQELQQYINNINIFTVVCAVVEFDTGWIYWEETAQCSRSVATNET